MSEEQKVEPPQPAPVTTMNEDLDLDEEELKMQIDKVWNPQLLEACKKGDEVKLKEALEKGADILQFNEKKKRAWTPLIWACCNGHRDIVRILIDHEVLEPYIRRQQILLGETDIDDDEDEQFERIQSDNSDDESQNVDSTGRPVYGRINTDQYPSPLGWACFKCHVEIVWLLLKGGLKPIDYDLFGNTVMHQAVSGGNPYVFRCLLMYGIKLDEMNSRKHYILDLATDQVIYNLIVQYYNTKVDEYSNQKFMPGETKYLCGIENKFYKEASTVLAYEYESHKSFKKEVLIRRNLNCQSIYDGVSSDLRGQMLSEKENNLRSFLIKIDSTPVITNHVKSWNTVDVEAHEPHRIDEKLMHDAFVLLEKIRTQNVIKKYISKLVIIKNYKTIKKHINVINGMIDDADDRGVNIDMDFRKMANGTNDRILAERNLRFELDNLEVATATPYQVKQLQNLVRIATEKKVSGNYLSAAGILQTKMEESICVGDILKEFTEYPSRYEDLSLYPPEVVMDPKDREPKNPFTMRKVNKKKFPPELLKALMEPPKPPKKKKRKKKGPPEFSTLIPEWALDEAADGDKKAVMGYKKMKKKLDDLGALILKKDELCLGEELIKKCQVQIIRLTKEFKYRWCQDVQIRLHEQNTKK